MPELNGSVRSSGDLLPRSGEEAARVRTLLPLPRHTPSRLERKRSTTDMMILRRPCLRLYDFRFAPAGRRNDDPRPLRRRSRPRRPGRSKRPLRRIRRPKASPIRCPTTTTAAAILLREERDRASSRACPLRSTCTSIPCRIGKRDPCRRSTVESWFVRLPRPRRRPIRNEAQHLRS